jgi:hypothetical protein
MSLELLAPMSLEIFITHIYERFKAINLKPLAWSKLDVVGRFYSPGPILVEFYLWANHQGIYSQEQNLSQILQWEEVIKETEKSDQK